MSAIQPTIQALYETMRSKAMQDPIIRALFNHEINWADVEDENPKSPIEHLHELDVQLMDAIRREMKLTPVDDQPSAPKVRFADPTPLEQIRAVFQKPPVVETVTSIKPEALFNPRQIKTVIARNLPRDITPNELSIVFEKHGPIRDIYIPRNTDQSSPYFGSIKGFALIKYLSSTDSTRAVLAESTRLYIRGKQIAIEYAKEDR